MAYSVFKIALGFIGKHNFPWLKMFLLVREWQILSAKFMVYLYQARIPSNWPMLESCALLLKNKSSEVNGTFEKTCSLPLGCKSFNFEQIWTPSMTVQ